MLATLEYLFLMLTWNLLLERYDPNHVIDWEENPIEDIFFNKMLWFMVSNAFCKSISIIPVKRPESKPVRILSVRLSLSKIHLGRYESSRKILLILSWDINLNSGPVHGIQNQSLFHVLPFHDCIFSGDGFYYHLNSLSENVRRN